jgi:hypothetical protein
VILENIGIIMVETIPCQFGALEAHCQRILLALEKNVLIPHPMPIYLKSSCLGMSESTHRVVCSGHNCNYVYTGGRDHSANDSIRESVHSRVLEMGESIEQIATEMYCEYFQSLESLLIRIQSLACQSVPDKPPHHNTQIPCESRIYAHMSALEHPNNESESMYQSLLCSTFSPFLL